jgi:uncharacterized protein (DUF58 family)
MVTDDKQYEFITSRITDLSNATEDGLKLFVPMFSAILGGSIWLRLQIQGAAPPSYQFLSNWLMVLLTAVCIFLVLYNLWAWWGYRNQLVKITRSLRHPAPPPRWASAIIEAVLCAAMAIACGIFIAFNPFGISN